MAIYNQKIIKTATILINETETNFIDCEAYILIGIITPSMTGSSLSFKGSIDNINFIPMYDVSGENFFTSIGAESRYIPFAPMDFFGLRAFKLVSDEVELAERNITIILRKIQY